ncbi:hypothetical protein ACFLT2_13025 [Acidobacteriota bacterium]
MGPFLLVDKSFIESLSPEEIDFLDRHYMVIITPILIREICANLLKYPDDEQLSKNKVSMMAKKAKQFDAKTVCHYGNICTADLNGADVRLEPIIPRIGGHEVVAPDGSKGVIFEESYEDKLLRRWESGNFTEADLSDANDHYEKRSYDLESSGKEMADEFPRNAVYKSLNELASNLDYQFSNYPEQWQIIESLMNTLNLAPQEREEIKFRWEANNRPSFKDFSRYAFFCYRLGSMFWIGVTSGLIPTSKHEKAIIDYEYIYYLPFVHTFCSRDSFHRDFSSFFLRDDQDFIWGDDLKADLKVISSFNDNMTDDEKKYYAINFGHYPPPIPESITNILWQKHMRPWTPKSGNLAIEMSEETKKEMSEKINEILEAYNKTKA